MSDNTQAPTANPAAVRACTIRNDYQVPGTNHTLLAGTDGWCTDAERGDQVHFEFLYPEYQDCKGKLILPRDVLEIGAVKRDPLPIRSDCPTADPSWARAARKDMSDGKDVLHTTLIAFFTALDRNRDVIFKYFRSMAFASKQMLLEMDASSYAEAVYNCIKPDARAIMANGNFNPVDLGTLDHVTQDWPTKGTNGFYILLYDDCKDLAIGDRSFTSAIYVGQTGDFPKRNNVHLRDQEMKMASKHYKIARGAGVRKMIPLLLASQDAPPNFLDIAEFAIACLFQSCLTELTCPPDNIDFSSVFAFDIEEAKFFSKVFQEVAEETGWQPAQLYGLNWTPRIFKIGERD